MNVSLVQPPSTSPPRAAVVITAEWCPRLPEAEHTDADTAQPASLCCAACGHTERLEVASVARCANQIVELHCAGCDSITLALCPQDLGVPHAPPTHVRGFFCRTLLCCQQFLLAPAAADALATCLEPGQFSQHCPRCEAQFSVRIPGDLWSAFQNTLQRWNSVANLTPVGSVPITARTALAPGTPLGAYVIERAVAEGGAAVVYAALGPGREPVALKVLHGELLGSSRVRRRFRREAEVLANIRHPNVVRLIERGEVDGHAFLVLERLEGPSLRERLWENHILSADEAFSLFDQLIEALSAVHAAGFAHCDVKPENVVLSTSGRATLIDLGIAEPLGGPRPEERTPDAVGSPSYMAPEQIFGGRVGPHTDVYSLGLVLYEVLTDGWPWPERRPMTHDDRLMRARGPARSSPVLDRKCPTLSHVVLQCLATDPLQRPGLGDIRHRLAQARRRWATPHVGHPGILQRLRSLMGA